MKTFYSLEDIEKLAAQGVRELVVDEDAVLTDLARNAAALLGLRLVAKGSAASSPKAAAAASAATLGSSAPSSGCQGGPRAETSPMAAANLTVMTPGSGAKPRGCQHGALTGTAPSPSAARAAGSAGGLVDDLVGAVKQLANRASAG